MSAALRTGYCDLGAAFILTRTSSERISANLPSQANPKEPVSDAGVSENDWIKGGKDGLEDVDLRTGRSGSFDDARSELVGVSPAASHPVLVKCKSRASIRSDERQGRREKGKGREDPHTVDDDGDLGGHCVLVCA